MVIGNGCRVSLSDVETHRICDSHSGRRTQGCMKGRRYQNIVRCAATPAAARRGKSWHRPGDPRKERPQHCVRLPLDSVGRKRRRQDGLSEGLDRIGGHEQQMGQGRQRPLRGIPVHGGSTIGRRKLAQTFLEEDRGQRGFFRKTTSISISRSSNGRLMAVGPNEMSHKRLGQYLGSGIFGQENENLSKERRWGSCLLEGVWWVGLR